jgi:hypothetical protein
VPSTNRIDRVRDELPDVSLSPLVEHVSSLGQMGKSAGGRVREVVTSLTVLSAASAAVYIALSSPERRERIKDAICRAINFSGVLANDFRDYDEGYL